MVGEIEKYAYKELSHEIIGCFYEVFNNIGFGYKEKHYCNAVAKELGLRKIPFKREEYSILLYKDSPVGKFFFDFTNQNASTNLVKTTVESFVKYAEDQNEEKNNFSIFEKIMTQFRELLTKESEYSEKKLENFWLKLYREMLLSGKKYFVKEKEL